MVATPRRAWLGAKAGFAVKFETRLDAVRGLRGEIPSAEFGTLDALVGIESPAHDRARSGYKPAARHQAA
jgi:hypothetical protein